MRFEAGLEAPADDVVIDEVSGGRDNRPAEHSMPRAAAGTPAEQRLEEERPPDRCSGVQRDANGAIAPVPPIARGRLAAVIDVRDGVQRPGRVAVLEVAAKSRRGGGSRRGDYPCDRGTGDQAPPIPRTTLPVPSGR